jgi:hypothetical protein
MSKMSFLPDRIWQFVITVVEKGVLTAWPLLI